MCQSNDSDHSSRRAFLQTGITGALATQVSGEANSQSSAPHSPFQPATRPRRISENLFVLEDTCNVYLIRDGSHAVLIDFGSGAILKYLGDLGISSIDWILHTHHHRDQAQGDYLAVAQRIPIAVPVHERYLFEDAENFWRNRRIFELYYVRNDFFSLTRDVPVAAVLRDYSTFRWREHEFFIQPTPGHTPGSISLVTQVDGRKVVFSGDLMHSPGKVQFLYDLQYYYAEHEGVDLSAYSLAQLVELKPELLCPSHGSELADPIPGMQQLIENLAGWYRFWNPGGGFTLDNHPRQLTPHIISNSQTTSSFYAIISDSGKGLFIDYGAASWNFFLAFKDAVDPEDRFRFVEHSIGALRARHGLKSIDLAIPSHMHDDHVNGFPYLSQRYGTRFWCYENMVEIFSNPKGRNLGCTFAEPIKIERSLRDRETFRWEEFEFTIVHSPGHTNYQSALFTNIDGMRIAFTGDAFFSDAGKPQLRHNLIYRNDVKSGDHLKSIRNILEFEPHILAPGHGDPFLIDREMALDFAEKMKRQDAFFQTLIADRDTDLGLDPSWIEIYPYQAIAMPGQTRQYEIRVKNLRRRAIELQVALSLPAGWECDPRIVKLGIAARETGKAPVSVTIPRDWRGTHPRIAIAADVLADGKYLGQIAEAVIDVRSSAVPPAAINAAGF
jgi:glyoxylase-like metal-dependent hydrolase (beta-lactamase superfamily II)